MALCLFGYLHGLLTIHFKVTNSVLITEIPLFFLSVYMVTFLTVVCARSELIPGFHLQDCTPCAVNWTESHCSLGEQRS